MAGAGYTPTSWIWRNGEMVRWEDATIHVLSHVVHYGSSIFEGIRCYHTPDGPAIFRLKEHMRRFIDSAKIYRMDLPQSMDELTAACEQVVAENGLNECYIRPRLRQPRCKSLEFAGRSLRDVLGLGRVSR
jgi:branched-chain amino acid aminotransferase